MSDDVADLAQRVAALEAAAAPSYTPLSGLKVAADGSTTYDFDGHVHARGLDLDAGTISTPAADQKVRWVAAAGGAVVAELGAYTVGSTTGAFWLTEAGNQFAQLALAAHPSGGNLDQVIASAGTSGSAKSAKVLAGDDSSAFLRGSNVLGDSGSISAGVNLWAGISFTLDHRADWLAIVTSCSGFVNTAAQTAAWQLLLDGVFVGSQSFLFNNALDHHQMGLIVGVVQNVPAGVHTLQHVNPSSPLAIDVNDNCAWLVIG